MANSTAISGNIGTPGELKYFANGDPVCSFSVADNQFGKEKDGSPKKPIWWRCSIFGKRAESLANMLTKGTPVTVFGQITQREWSDDQGVRHQAMDVRVNEVALQGGKRESASDGGWDD